MKFKEGVAYIVTKDTIRAFVEDVDKTDLRMYDDIKEVKDLSGIRQTITGLRPEPPFTFEITKPYTRMTKTVKRKVII